MDYVELYLIHSPWFAKLESKLQSAWAEMEKEEAAGKSKSIGVSNYLVEHLETTMKTAKVLPAVNQVEFHPYIQRQNLVLWSDGKGIATSAFGPLSSITEGKPGPVDAVIGKLARKYWVSEEAVCLRWCMQQGGGVAAITTSSKEERLRGYIGAVEFELTREEVKDISDKGGEKHMRCKNFMHVSLLRFPYDPPSP
jgi:diketogulonate reductase-like aldo/keto reductase